MLKLDNSLSRFYFKAYDKRTGYFHSSYQSVSKTADSRENCKQDFKLVTLSKPTFPATSFLLSDTCKINKSSIKHHTTQPHLPKSFPPFSIEAYSAWTQENNKHLCLLYPNNLNSAELRPRHEPHGDAKSPSNSGNAEEPSPPLNHSNARSFH